MSEWTARVRSVTDVGPNAVAIELETPDGFEAAPGQFVLIRGTVEGESYARHYTLSSPTVASTFELTVGIDPEGAFSGWLAGRTAGDTLDIEGPFGNIAYGGDGPVRVIAGGPGIGAGLGVVERAVSAGHDGGIAAQPGEDGLIHTDRFDRLAGDHPTLIADTPAELTEAVARLYEAIPDGTTYVFGFQSFVELAGDAIEHAGGDIDAVQIESYG